MKSPLKKSIGEVVTDYGAKVMKVFKEGLLGRSLFDFYGDVKALTFRTKEVTTVPTTPPDGKGGVIYTKTADGKLYYKSNEISEVELSSQGSNTTYSVSCVDGDNSDEEKIRLTGSDSSTDDVVLEAGTGLSIARDSDKITFTNTVTDTNTQNTTTLSFVDSSNDVILRNTTGGAGSGTDDIKFVAGSNVTLTHTDADNITISSTDTNTVYSEATGSAEGLMSIAHHDKLDGIESSADVTDTTNVTAAGALMDSELTDLAGVKGVTISTLQVKPSEGAFANGDKTKLDGIEAGATADQTNVSGTAATVTAGAQPNITSLGTLTGLTVSGNPSFTSDSFTITSATAQKPELSIINSNTDTKPPLIILQKTATGGALDGVGSIAFKGDDDGDNEHVYAQIQSQIVSAANNSEAGKTSFEVATSAGSGTSTKVGLLLTGSATADDVDVTIGAETTSLTTITGDLQINGNDIKDDDGTTCITFDSSGNTTISNDLTVGGVAGDATLVISADTDNATETDNARLWFKQDGDITEGAIQMSSNVLNIINNISTAGGISFQTGTTNNTGTTDPATGATERMSIASDGTITVDGITSTPSSGAAISLNSSSATGSPYIEFTQNGTRRTFIQHNDTGNTLKLASEFGAISLLTASDGSEVERLGISSAGVVSTSGDLTVGGDLTVSGNDIKDSGGNAAIALNGSGGFTTPDHVTFSKTVTVGGAGSTFALGIRTATITLSTANCNDLHTTPQTLVGAGGANTVIVPTGGLIRVDRASTQNNSASNMDFHYADQEPGTFGETSLFHIRRFMYNDAGDRVFVIGGLSGVESSQNLTDDVNKDLEVSVASALTTNCITSLTIYLTYNVIDIS